MAGRDSTTAGIMDRLVAMTGERLSLWILALLFAIFMVLPFLAGEFWIHVATEILIFGLFAMSFNLIYGYMGQVSFGHAAFFGLGAYGTALMFREFSGGTGEIAYWQFFAALAAGIPVAALGALIVGFFCVRLSGIYFAILTLAFGELVYFVVFSWYGFTGGDDGIQRLLPPPALRDPVGYYYLSLAIVSVCTAILWRITRSPFGYILRAMRDNQQRTRFLGINVRLYMLVNFVIAGTFAGVAGTLWGPLTRSVSPGLLNWQESGIAIFMTLLGGSGFFAGPLIGSIIYTFLNAWVTGFTVYWPFIIGSIILLMVMFFPGGLLGALDLVIKSHARSGANLEPAHRAGGSRKRKRVAPKAAAGKLRKKRARA